MIDTLTTNRELTELIERNGLDSHCNIPAYLLSRFLLDIVHSLTVMSKKEKIDHEAGGRMERVIDQNKLEDPDPIYIVCHICGECTLYLFNCEKCGAAFHQQSFVQYILRIDKRTYDELTTLAYKLGIPRMAYIQRLLNKHAEDNPSREE